MVLDPGFLACCDCTDNCQVCWATFTLTLSIFWFLDRSVQGGKAQTGYTALIESLTHEIQNTEPRPDRNTGNSMSYSFRLVFGFFNVRC